MANYRSVQLHIDKGRGIAAAKVGEPVLVYRIGLNPNATAVFDPGNLLFPTYCRFKRMSGGDKTVETMPISPLIYELTMNVNNMLVGDIIAMNDPTYDNNSYFYLATKRPVMKNVGVRVESAVAVYRPLSLSSGNYSGIIRNPKTNNQPLVLKGQTLSGGSTGETPVLIPCGLQNQHRMMSEIRGEAPTSTRIDYWLLTIPPLPGVQLREDDWILLTEVSSVSGSVDGIGDPNAGSTALDQQVRGYGNVPAGVSTRHRYFLIHIPYYNPFGLAGYQLLCEDVTVSI